MFSGSCWHIAQLHDRYCTVLHSLIINLCYRNHAVHCRLLEEAGGVDLMVTLLQDHDSGCRQYAAECVSTMAPDGEVT